MILSFTFLLFFLSQFQLTFSAYCSGAPDPGERSTDYPIYDTDLRFVRSVKNAILYEAGPANATFPVVHLFGNPYEVGYAQGELMKNEIRDFVSKTWTYLVELIVDELGPYLSPEQQAILVNRGMKRALDWCAEVTAPFTPQAYFDEMQGIADATGVDYDTILRVNLFPELTKAQCSFFGAWGEATATTGKTYQLRALDFDTVGPFKDYHQVTVYHPTDGGHPYAQVAWPGNVGSLTGMSSQQLAISEIGVYFSDDSFGQGTDNTPPQKVHGEPWMFVLRDVLQYSSSLEEAIDRISTSNRTCNLIIGVGDGEENMVNGIEYSGYVAVPYNDETLLPENDTWHGQINDVVYNGMDWNCPGYNEVLGEQLNKYHGNINEDTTAHYILPTVQTGNLHIAIYDLTDQKLHVSFARKSTADPSEPMYAYERQFTRLDMKKIFSEQPPAVN